MTKFALAFVGLISSSVFAAEPKITIPYDSLLAKQETMIVRDVQAKLVTDQNGLPRIQLLVTATNACGKQTLVNISKEKDGNTGVQFFQIGSLGLHIQPACLQVIEYYMQPGDYDLQDGQSKNISFYVGPISYVRSSDLNLATNSIVVKVKGPFGNGFRTTTLNSHF